MKRPLLLVLALLAPASCGDEGPSVPCECVGEIRPQCIDDCAPELAASSANAGAGGTAGTGGTTGATAAGGH